MVPRDLKPPPALMVRPVFEPSRLAPTWLADAYERLVPSPRRPRRRPPTPAPAATTIGAPREGQSA